MEMTPGLNALGATIESTSPSNIVRGNAAINSAVNGVGSQFDQGSVAGLGSIGAGGDTSAAQMTSQNAGQPQRNVTPAQLVAMDYAQHGVKPPASAPAPQRSRGLAGPASAPPFQATAGDPTAGQMDLGIPSDESVTADSINRLMGNGTPPPDGLAGASPPIDSALAGAPPAAHPPLPAGDTGTPGLHARVRAA
jgi:hypothetical protein